MKVYHHRNKQRVNEVVNQKRIIKIQKLLKAKAHHHRNKPKANEVVNQVKKKTTPSKQTEQELENGRYSTIISSLYQSIIFVFLVTGEEETAESENTSPSKQTKGKRGRKPGQKAKRDNQETETGEDETGESPTKKVKGQRGRKAGQTKKTDQETGTETGTGDDDAQNTGNESASPSKPAKGKRGRKPAQTATKDNDQAIENDVGEC